MIIQDHPQNFLWVIFYLHCPTISNSFDQTYPSDAKQHFFEEQMPYLADDFMSDKY